MDDPSGEETPYEWMVSRVCEEFQCLPEAALLAIEEDRGGLIFKIMELRSYAKAKQIYEQDLKEQDPQRRQKGPLIDLVQSNMMDLAAEQFREAQQKAAESNDQRR